MKVKIEHPIIYTAWLNMKARCLNPNNPRYHTYGKRGILICEDWNNSRNFVEWALANGWKKGLTLDRTDNDGDYTPGNCKWISLKENSRKRGNIKLGKKSALAIRALHWMGVPRKDIAERYNVTTSNIGYIVRGKTWQKE